MQQITWNDFQKIELIVGTIISAKPFKEAHKPAYIIQADFGPNVGLLKSSAQITTCYQADDLIGQQIIGVVNLPAKQIGPIHSQFLITGFYRSDGSVILAKPEREIDNGAKLS
ncbi:MAG: tRNA-binding protein [Acidiferrobacteraceae bacterium]|nr:tRNA-binding protein [Acidiferrobacteraceae bacterium]|tara:strand:- start:12301 stop:12639 length:339 start_codon:yes stop_codon:yes gene_type:complete